MGSVPLRRIQVPTRIDLAGGWTDVAEFSAEHGGLVLIAGVEPGVEASVIWGDDGLELRFRVSGSAARHVPRDKPCLMLAPLAPPR